MNRKMRISFQVLALFFAVSSGTPAHSTQYTVNGFVLDAPISPNNSNYKVYKCHPSIHFEGMTECAHTKSQTTSLGTGALTNKIWRTEDGTAVYIMADLSPVTLNDGTVRREIGLLSKEFNQRPKSIKWFAGHHGSPKSVIVVWGNAILRPLGPGDYTIFLGTDVDPVWPGIYLDPLGNLYRSVKNDLPIFRVTGGPGYVYCASFDKNGRGHRHYAAIDTAQPLVRRFERQLDEIMRKDESRAANDYGLWPDVAELTRILALDTSVPIANGALDHVLEKDHAKKFSSHVWSLLPLTAENALRYHVHSVDSNVFGQNTMHPTIRHNIKAFLHKHPSEPFREFLYYVIGDFDKALQTNPNSVIADVLNYARGFDMLQSLLQNVPTAIKKTLRFELNTTEKYPANAKHFVRGPVNRTLVALNWFPELYNHKLLVNVIPDFAKRSAKMRPYFEAVLRNKTSPLADDAAYMLGWLAYNRGQFKQALVFLSEAMSVGNKDYQRPAMRQVVRTLSHYSPREQAKMIRANWIFAKQPAFWYAAARSAFRTFDYKTATQIGEQGLSVLGLPLARIPATTDPQKISAAIEKIIPRPKEYDPDKAFDYENADEIPYIIEASREILQYEHYLKTVASNNIGSAERSVMDIILQYSLLSDHDKREASYGSRHKDLRQAIHLIDLTLAGLPVTPPYFKLREWLYYRKIRTLEEFNPSSVKNAVAAMRSEFPRGDLVDDALAEEIFAEGVELKTLVAAERSFRTLIDAFPNENAVDNAYTWMAIIYRCMGRKEKARKINADILRRFPLSRHAALARQRMAHPGSKACGLSEFSK